MLGCAAGCLCHTSTKLLVGDIATPAWGSQTLYLCGSRDSPERLGQLSIQAKWSFGAGKGAGFGLRLLILAK